ncbi:MAG: PTS sugar transporter subunit IIA [Planctomycetota bacterium]
MKLSEIVVERAVVPELQATDRDGVIEELVGSLVEAGAASETDRPVLIERLLAREQKSSTGFGRGVAVPHAKHASVSGISVAIGVSRGGVDFASLDKQPVYSVFLLLSPEDQPDAHLTAMEAIFRHLSKDTFRRALRQTTNVDEIKTLLVEVDAQNLGG